MTSISVTSQYAGFLTGNNDAEMTAVAGAIFGAYTDIYGKAVGDSLNDAEKRIALAARLKQAKSALDQVIVLNPSTVQLGTTLTQGVNMSNDLADAGFQVATTQTYPIRIYFNAEPSQATWDSPPSSSLPFELKHAVSDQEMKDAEKGDLISTNAYSGTEERRLLRTALGLPPVYYYIYRAQTTVVAAKPAMDAVRDAVHAGFASLDAYFRPQLPKLQALTNQLLAQQEKFASDQRGPAATTGDETTDVGR